MFASGNEVECSFQNKISQKKTADNVHKSWFAAKILYGNIQKCTNEAAELARTAPKLGKVKLVDTNNA